MSIWQALAKQSNRTLFTLAASTECCVIPSAPFDSHMFELWEACPRHNDGYRVKAGALDPVQTWLQFQAETRPDIVSACYKPLPMGGTCILSRGHKSKCRDRRDRRFRETKEKNR